MIDHIQIRNIRRSVDRAFHDKPYYLIELADGVPVLKTLQRIRRNIINARSLSVDLAGTSHDKHADNIKAREYIKTTTDDLKKLNLLMVMNGVSFEEVLSGGRNEGTDMRRTLGE